MIPTGSSKTERITRTWAGLSRREAAVEAEALPSERTSTHSGHDLDFVAIRVVDIERLDRQERVLSAANRNAKLGDALALGPEVSGRYFQPDVVQVTRFLPGRGGLHIRGAWRQDDLHRD